MEPSARRHRSKLWLGIGLMVAAGLWLVWQLTDGPPTPLSPAEQLLVGNWTRIDPDDGSARVLTFSANRKLTIRTQDSPDKPVTQLGSWAIWHLDGSTLVYKFRDPIDSFHALLKRLVMHSPIEREPILLVDGNRLRIGNNAEPLEFQRGEFPAQEIAGAGTDDASDAKDNADATPNAVD